jgi:hypothetical protein
LAGEVDFEEHRLTSFPIAMDFPLQSSQEMPFKRADYPLRTP